MNSPTIGRGVAAPDRAYERVPGLSDAPRLERLRYVGQLLIGLKDLLREHELAFLRYLVAMAVEEAQAQARKSAAANVRTPTSD